MTSPPWGHRRPHHSSLYDPADSSACPLKASELGAFQRLASILTQNILANKQTSEVPLSVTHSPVLILHPNTWSPNNPLLFLRFCSLPSKVGDINRETTVGGKYLLSLGIFPREAVATHTKSKR